MKGFIRSFTLFSTLLLTLHHAAAISFDKLIDAQQTVVSGASSSQTSTLFPAQNALGGSRYVEVQKNLGTLVFTNIDGGFLDHSQNASTRGSSFYVWDGTPAMPGLQTTGLGGIDITADAATAIKVVVDSFDFPNNQPITISFTLYDASDPTGVAKSSKGSIVLNAAVNAPTTFEIPYASLVPLVSQPASLTNIGAVAMFIDGTQSPAHDLTLTFVGTNGVCEHVPVNGFIKDQCNVCNGDNSTCSDCEGIPNGTKVAGTSCPTGQPGVCSNGTYVGNFPNCSCTPVTPPSNEICDGLDNDCDGLIDENNPTTGPLVDQCGVCGGNNSTCKDCRGIPNGGAQVDQCGVCAGNNSTCLDCAGTPNGSAKLDQCGVCGGNGTSCLDCKGTVNGTAKIDQCGVCGGNDTSCMDCKGVINGASVLDQCGVCGGDSTSCCSATDLTTILASLDSGAKEQELIVKKAASLLAKLDPRKTTIAQNKKLTLEANQLQIRNWTLSWTVPIIASSCDHTVQCATTSNTPMLSEYRTHNERLKRIAKDLIARINKIRRTSKSTAAKSAGKQVTTLSKWSDRVFSENLKLTFMVPETQLLCGGSTTLSDIN